MNRLRTKKTVLILLLASYASAVYAAAQPEQLSLWQRTKSFVATHAVVIGLGSAPAVVGAYELVARKFELPTLEKLGATAIEKIKTDRVSQALVTGIALAGGYELAAKPLNLPTIVETIKKDLITRSDNADACIPPLEQLFRQVPGGNNLFLPRRGQPEPRPSAIEHIAHGIRLQAYSFALNGLYYSLASKFMGAFDNLQIYRSSGRNISMGLMFSAIVMGPIAEELFCTYGPSEGLGKWAQWIMPPIFAGMHIRHPLSFQVMKGISNFLRNRSLYVRPEYTYAPIISHMFHNAMVIGLFYHLGKSRQ